MLLAWVLTVFVFVGIVAGTAHGPRAVPVAATIGLVIVVIARWDATVLPTGKRMASGLRIAAGTAAGILVVGVVTALLATNRSDRPSMHTAVQLTLSRMFRGTSTGPAPDAIARVVDALLPAATGLAVLVALAIVMLPMPDETEPDLDVRRRVESLCTGADSDAMAPFSRRRDKNYVFSPDHRAVIGYRVVAGVCVAGPGPVGAASAHMDAMAAFVQRCDERGWRPAMIGATDNTRRLARDLGLHAVCIGDETLLSTTAFRLDQTSMRNVRQAVNRTHNSGVTVTVHREGEIASALRTELESVVREWRRGQGELGFAMTLDRLLQNAYPDTMLFVAEHEGHVVGFQRYVPCHGGTVLSLDVMPRRPRAPNGINERLIAEVVEWGRHHDVEALSLNFAAFRTLFEAEPSTVRRLLRWGVHRLDPLLNVESLYRFNAKFSPTWIPRHVLYRSILDIPFVLFAALRLEFGHAPHAVPDAGADAVRTSPRRRQRAAS